jgi:hypothetical protein
MYSLQYRPHMDHFQYTQRGGGGAAAHPLCISLAWSICGGDNDDAGDGDNHQHRYYHHHHPHHRQH